MSDRKNQKEHETKFVSYENLDKIGETAVYYGFTPTKSPNVTKADVEAAKDILDGDDISDETEKGRLPMHAEEKIALMRMYQEQEMINLPQPVMLYFKDPCRGSIKKGGEYHRYADMEILGSSGSIAEAMLIQAALAMLREEDYRQTVVEINSVGDRDSLTRFVRELTAYYRKHINDMSPESRQLLKQDPIDLLACRDESVHELNQKAPKSLDFLSETSRRHLEEVLEYLEALAIPYSLNNSLIGNKKYCTETIFAITNTDPEVLKGDQKILALGVRYNGLAKKLGLKRDIQGVGISLLVKGSKSELRKSVMKVKRPIASFVQLGIESKLASLGVVEQLRQIKVPLYLSLAKDRLGAQVSSIEKYHTPYVIVMGKKEAVEKTVIVRKNDTHAQEIVPLTDLAEHMKKIEADYWR
ncbi:MAG: His/Gly/Thr/Pro-type tRNA ligase C-terminal domain-containing protein [Candidatus Paceibacterota bacterium]